MSVQIEKNTTKTPSPPLGEKERKGPRQTPDDDDDDDDVDVERRATMMMNLKKKTNLARRQPPETAQTRTLPRTLPEHLSKLTFPWIQILRFGARFPSWQISFTCNVRDGFAQKCGHTVSYMRCSFGLLLLSLCLSDDKP